MVSLFRGGSEGWNRGEKWDASYQQMNAASMEHRLGIPSVQKYLCKFITFVATVQLLKILHETLPLNRYLS